ncbi:glycine-rich domain-containing protein [Enterobacter kobei]
MRPLMPPVQTPDNLFHDGNPLTGELGTIVDAEHLNNVQGAVRDAQSELITVLNAAGINVDPSNQNQLLTALKALLLSRSNPFGDIKSDGTVKTALGNLGLGDGTGRLINILTFTSSGTYTPTAGTKKIRVRIIGGGGAGGGAAASTVSGYLAAGHGGNAGSYGETGLIDVSGTTSVAVIVGAAGVGSAGANGTAGGASSFGGYIIAPGGTGGNYGAAGAASNSWVPDYTQSDECTGTAMLISIPGQGGFGQMSFSTGSAKGGRGGSSVLGTGGSAFVLNAKGGYGWGFGGGGAGSVTTYANGTSATAGGHGARGQVIVEEYA